LLAAAAVETKKIKLSTAVTVLSSEDPVRVYEQFATLDQLSNGRAEIMVGRGSFIESFPLFGYDLHDYDELFEEKLNMLMALNKSERITWSGKLTQTLNNAGIYPRPYQKKFQSGKQWAEHLNQQCVQEDSDFLWH
jgi:alkanesulfonate monooxygenase SsuD/methylene tetrahydromethanopterin reductase-like flavin-dependent oxidoreductase (luciferase family)